MEGHDISKYFGYLVKTATRVSLSASICVGVGDDFEGQFAPEGYEVTPEADELFVHVSQILDNSCKGTTPGFAAVQVTGHLKVAKNRTRLLQASQQYTG